MARDIKINITADGSDFINELKNINNASYLSEKTISQLSTQYKNLSIAQKKGAMNSVEMATTFDDLKSKILKQANAYQILNGELKGLEKTQKLVAGILNTQLVLGVDENAQKELFGLNNTLTERINILKKEEQAAKSAAKAESELLKHDMMVALGDKAGLLQEKYHELENQLRQSIKTSGVASEKTKKLALEMNNLSEQIKKANYTPFNVKINNLLSSFVSAQAILWGVRSAFRLVTNTIQGSMQVASAAEETWNLFVTTFDEVENTAIKASTAIASSMGLATSTAQKAMGVFGDLALGYGQTDAAALEFAETLTKSTLDLISFKNISGSYDEIFSAIASGIAGNVENFRKYGVVITQAEVKTRLQQKGLDKLTGSSLQFAQMQERLDIFIEKTANAQGDMIKTMESTENVTRRLSEATKEWKENFGEDWNKIFTPVKRAIADYIESINRAREAEKQWAEGRTDISVYSDLNSEERRQELLNAMLKGVDIYSEANTLNALKKIMVMFSSSADEMISLYDSLDLGDNIGYLREPLERHENYYKTKNDRTSTLEKEKTKVKEVNNAYKNFTDTLNQIEGISIGALSSDNLVSSIANLVSNISNADSSSYSSPIDIALGLNSIEDDFKAKMESIKKLYEETYNFFLSQDGLLDNSEEETLKTIEDLYKITNKELDEHNAKIEAEKERLEAVKSAIESITNVAQEYQQKIANSNLESSIKNQFAGSSDAFINNEIARAQALAGNKASYETQKSNASGIEIKNLYDNFKLANEAINEYYDLLKKQIELEEKITRDEEAKSKSISYQQAFNSAIGWNQTQFTPTFSTYSPAQEKAAELYSSLISSIDEMVNSMEAAGIDQKAISESVRTIREQGLEYIHEIVENTENNLAKQEAKQSIESGLGESNKLIEAFTNGGSIMGNFAMILADLLVKTEAMTQLANILTDNVLPVLNAFLEPLLPLIEMMGDQLQMLTEAVLAPLFPIFKAIIKVAIIAQTLVNAVTGFVADSIKAMVGKIVTWVTEALNSINLFGWKPININNQWAKDWAAIDVGGNFTDKFDKMNQHLASIDKMTMEVADNTDPSNSEALKIYQDLYNNGTLSATQYAGYMSSLSGRNYDSVGILSSGLSYQKRNGGTYVAKQNVSIQINGSNLSEDELTNAIRNALESNTYAKGVA